MVRVRRQGNPSHRSGDAGGALSVRWMGRSLRLESRRDDLDMRGIGGRVGLEAAGTWMPTRVSREYSLLYCHVCASSSAQQALHVLRNTADGFPNPVGPESKLRDAVVSGISWSKSNSDAWAACRHRGVGEAE